MAIRLANWASAPMLAAALAGCGGGTPATVDEVIAQQGKELATEGHEITWVNAIPGEEPGKFRVIADRRETGKPDTEETLMCNVTQTSSSSSRVCQAIEPSVISRARSGLLQNYASRKLEVRKLDLARTGNGNKFAGAIVVVDPRNGQEVTIPCRGDQKEMDYQSDCKLEWASEAAAEQPAQ